MSKRISLKKFDVVQVKRFATIEACPLGHITKDKKLCYAWPKLPSATSFISNVLIKFCNMEEIK